MENSSCQTHATNSQQQDFDRELQVAIAQKIAAQKGTAIGIKMSDKPLEKLAEIPAAFDSVDSGLNELHELLSMLHRRLESVMPPSGPEVCGQAGNNIQEPTSPLGQAIAEHACRIRQASSSVRNLLDRIKL